MVDAAVLIREYLLTQAEVTSLLGTNPNGSIYAAYDLPEGFDPSLGPAIQLFRAGGHSHPEIPPLVDARVQIKAWADQEEYETSATLYAAINDVLHGACGITVADGTIVRALEVDGPMEMTDPDTAWVANYAFYQVLARPNGTSVPRTPAFYEGYGPPPAIEMSGDLYFDLGTGNLYEQIGTTWTLVGNVPQGGGGDDMNPSTNYHLVAASGLNAAVLKSTSGLLVGWKISNRTEYPVYVKVFNKATTPVPGTDFPEQTLGVQAGEDDGESINGGVIYSEGISIAITKGIEDSDNTPVVAGDCVIDIFYQ
jgi:hypothetical protein